MAENENEMKDESIQLAPEEQTASPAEAPAAPEAVPAVPADKAGTEETATAVSQEPAEQPAPAARSGHSTTVFSVPATITRQVYESIKKYLIPTSIKVIWLVVMALEVLTGLYGIIFEGSYFSLVLMILLGGLMIFAYFHMQNSAIKNVFKTHQELRNHGYKVVISFGSGIRLMNLTTGVERNLAYKEIISMAETDKAIVCFAKKDKSRKYLLIPKDQMTEEQHDAILHILQERCPQMKKRSW